MSAINKVVSFIRKYIGELTAVTGLIETIIGALPLNRSEKDNAIRLIDSLQASIENLTKALPGLEKEAKIVIKKEDIEAAVKKYLDEKAAADAKKA